MSDTETTGAAAPIFREIAAAQPAQTARTYAFQPIWTMTIVLLSLLGARLALGAVKVVGLVMQLQFIRRADAGDFSSAAQIHDAAALGDGLVQVTSVVDLLLLLASYVVGGMWIYRAACNVRGLGARGLETTPGWAVGWYAVPIMSLFRPFMAMSEIWRASHDPQRWKSRPAPPLLGFWWASWIAINLSGAVVNAMSKETDTLSGLSDFAKVNLTFIVVDSVAIALFAAVVWRITRAQSATRHMVDSVAEAFS